jgi:peptidoglycan/xylan/chitin deacetylase (PgdA/CDA1 family)
VSRIVSRTENGAIICLHDGRGVRADPDIGPTLEAVERIIPVLQSRGFIFETVSQILCPNN